VGWPGKTAGGFGFALIFLWLLSLYQDKESNNVFKKTNIETIRTLKVKRIYILISLCNFSLPCIHTKINHYAILIIRVATGNRQLFVIQQSG
jgi:hypothetical protein